MRQSKVMLPSPASCAERGQPEALTVLSNDRPRDKLSSMPLSAGSKLGPYEILSLLGAGGMGEVYRARDPRLGRDVAIKISAARFSERFAREARAGGALEDRK